MKRKIIKDREMLSYEDKPIEEYERDENKKEKKNFFKDSKVKAVIIIAVLLLVAVSGFGMWKYISPDVLQGSVVSSKIKGEGFPVEIKGKNVKGSDICTLNNNFAYISETQFQVLNASGGLVVDKRIKYASPALASSGNYSIIYDREGSDYEIQSSSGTIYEGNVEDDIFTATIQKNGAYAILSKKAGYTAKMTIFNKDNSQKYAYYFSECYATSVSLNSDTTKAVVCGLDAKDGSVISKVYVLDFSKEEPVAKIEFNNSTIYSVSFLSNGNIAAIGDQSAMIITSDYQNKYEFTYNGYNLTSKKITDDKIYLSLSPFEDGKSCEIWSISQNGITTTTKTGVAITSMDINSNIVAVLCNNKIRTFNTLTEEALYEYDAGIDAKSILFVNRNTVYVVGTSEIRTVQIN
ncbi:MAG: DUF5711 family protein [Acutalibacteraceae bacterium]|nr:DUF5711 family protein [Acutalibacteraceae bacterium]